MKVQGKVVVVTGGASGIGRALAARFVQEGARHVAIADLDDAKAKRVAAEISEPTCKGYGVDVAREADLQALVEKTSEVGPIDLTIFPLHGWSASAPAMQRLTRSWRCWRGWGRSWMRSV